MTVHVLGGNAWLRIAQFRSIYPASFHYIFRFGESTGKLTNISFLSKNTTLAAKSNSHFNIF